MYIQRKNKSLLSRLDASNGITTLTLQCEAIEHTYLWEKSFVTMGEGRYKLQKRGKVKKNPVPGVTFQV
jgi:hypothetical protein